MDGINHVSTLLCDYILQDMNFKPSLMGVFFNIVAQSFPGGVPGFFVFVSFQTRDPIAMDLKVQIANEDGTWTHTVTQQHVTPPPGAPTSADMPADELGFVMSSNQVSNLMFPYAGIYQVQLHINGELIHSTPLMVSLAKDSNATQRR